MAVEDYCVSLVIMAIRNAPDSYIEEGESDPWDVKDDLARSLCYHALDKAMCCCGESD